MGFIFNLINKLIKTILKLSLYLAIFATIIVLIPNLPPYTKFSSIQISPIQPQQGPLAPNEALNNAEKLYKGKLIGPEAFQLLHGELFTSLATGEIVKISPGGHVTFVTKVGQPCTGLIKEHICGRPLGFQIDDKGQSLYVADAYHGIWKIDLKTDKKQLLVSPRVEIEKRQPKLFNSIALAKNGDFYWTDSSSDFHLKDGAISLLTDPSGRLFHYDAARNESKVLLDDLWFANGVVLSPNNEFLVVSETSRYRLVKYYVAGPKKGQSEVFVDGLPGAPDNVRVLPDGSGILVGLYTVFDDDHPILTRSMSATPVIRKFFARLQRLIEIPFEYFNNLYPYFVFEEIVYYIGHFKSVSGLAPAMAGLLQVDWNGNIMATYYNTDGTLDHISDAIVYNEKLYTGSPHGQDFVGAVPAPPLLKKAFQSTKKNDSPKLEAKQQSKPVEQAPIKKIEEKSKVLKAESKLKVEEKPNMVINSKVVDKPKVEEKPKVVIKPKVEDQPKLEEKPKQATKPKVEDTPKVDEKLKVATKPKVEGEPKAEEKKVVPKVAKPISPQQAKPAEPTKPVQKPADKQSSGEVKAPQQARTTPPPVKVTPPTSKTEPGKKQTQTESKPPTTSKPAEKTTSPPPKTTKPKATETTTEAPKKAQAPVKQESPKPTDSKPRPIKEEIPSDTVKPTKETLKVIKKDGPAEIPVRHQ